MRVAGLVLAAGAGTRFGRPKALVELDGRRFVDLAVDHLRAGGADPVLVVVGASTVGHVDAIVVVNDRWTEGIGSSLAAGLAAAQVYADTSAPLDGAVVMLVDQPKIEPEAVRRLLDAGSSGAHVAVATYGGVPLHPVFLSVHSWLGVVDSAHGELGARPYIQDHPDLVELVACDGLGDASDVDTPGDLERLGTTTR